MRRGTGERYQEIKDRHKVPSLREKVRLLEEELWHGLPGETPLLQLEATELREQGRRDRDRSGEPRPELLILPVGRSPEPLLFAVAYHEPRDVSLLVPDSLPPQYCRELSELWDELAPELGVPEFDEAKGPEVRDEASDVFRAIQKLIAEHPEIEPSRLVIDITGGKKSMTGGAFLAAGYCGVTASYIDFDEYDELLRRPVPGSPRPGRLVHPEELFRLRDRQRLRELFDARRYPEARELAQDLRRTAESAPVRDALGVNEAESLAAELGRVAAVARAYEDWSSGFYADALEALAEAAEIPVAPTLMLLAAIWPRRGEEAERVVEALAEDVIFRDPRVPLAYFLDVLVWASDERIQADPRGAFLRLFGTVESAASFLFEGFVARHPERLVVEPKEPGELAALEGLLGPDGRTVDWSALLEQGVVSLAHRSSRATLELLGGKAKEPTPKDLGEEAFTSSACSRASQPRLGKGLSRKARAAVPACRVSLTERLLDRQLAQALFERGSLDGQEGIVSLRHKAAHWLAPVPAGTALAVCRYLCELLRSGMPRALEGWGPSGDSEPDELGNLAEWTDRLLAACRGEISGDCEPLTYDQLQAHPELERSLSVGRSA